MAAPQPWNYKAIRAPKRTKYGAKAVTIDGIRFASQKEARRYGELKLLERIGDISELELQPNIPCVVNGVLVCHYRGDFRYLKKDGTRVLEDVKGMKTPVYRLKRSLLWALYGTEILET